MFPQSILSCKAFLPSFGNMAYGILQRMGARRDGVILRRFGADLGEI